MSECTGGWTSEFHSAFGPAANDLNIKLELGVITIRSERARKSWTFKETDSPAAAAAKIKRELGLT